MGILGLWNKSNDRTSNDGRKKKALFRYFETLYRTFPKLVAFNLIYFACILPLVCGVAFLACAYFPEVFTPEVIDTAIWLNVLLRLSSWLPVPVSIVLLFVSAVAYGPLTAGFTYAMRNLATGQHAWYSDMFRRAKANLKQGLLLGILDLLVLISCMTYLASDFSAIQGATYYIYSTFRVLAVIITVLYTCARFYTYSIAVTFELRLRDILKNAIIFIVLGILNNIVALFIIALVIISFISTPRIDIVLISALFFSICRFSVSFATYPIIKKYMLSPAKKGEKISDEKGAGD